MSEGKKEKYNSCMFCLEILQSKVKSNSFYFYDLQKFIY